VAPGRYVLTAEKTGFRKAVRESVEVAVNETGVADIALALVTERTAQLAFVPACTLALPGHPFPFLNNIEWRL
jgi:hypothetical protein